VDLSDGAIHAWCANVAQPDEQIGWLRDTHSREEKERADRIQLEENRKRFIAGRGVLRVILSKYTGCAPRDLRFDLGPHGKPALNPQFGGGAIRFNVSHSRDLVLCIVSLHRNVGVDVEFVRPLPAIDRMAARVLSSHEAEAWRTLPAEEKLAAFFATWTRKEALVKGLGERLSATFARVDVSLVPGQQAVMLPGQAGRPDWMIYPLPLSDGYVGAVAVEGGIEQALHWQSYRFEQEF
jgi:4'-phosphopantetheinyl transferase